MNYGAVVNMCQPNLYILIQIVKLIWQVSLSWCPWPSSWTWFRRWCPPPRTPPSLVSVYFFLSKNWSILSSNAASQSRRIMSHKTLFSYRAHRSYCSVFLRFCNKCCKVMSTKSKKKQRQVVVRASDLRLV